jgi:riboflavin synthase alpha subunit
MEHTVCGSYRSGTRVNIETDILGKYASRSRGETRGGRFAG